MRILLVATDVQVPGSHGGSTHVAELFAGLSKRADTLLLARADSTGDRVVPLGKPLRHRKQLLRQLDPAALLPRAWREARAFRPDVIYERCSSYGLGAMLSAALGAPLLTMVLDERFSWLSLLRAEKLVATRLDLIPRAVRGKAELVHWGANVERFAAFADRDAARAAAGFRPGDFVVAYSGSFKRWHGLEALVEVADRWRDSAVRFLMVGDGPCRTEVEAALRQRGLADRFVFTGSLPYADVPGSMAAADVCVAPFDPSQHGPSRERGSFVLDPLKVFEYLAQE
ncbi:MAG TPA: glycosyltransferase, partial [Polyangiaceae bacterium]|nr:glycosyltransferase [Polyangiaceae bacterium]